MSPSPMDYVVNKAWAAHVLFGAGIVAFHRPDRILKLGVTLARWGATPAAGYAASAVRYPDEPAIIDELGTLSFKDVHERTNRLTNALSDAGINEGDNVGVLCRNHRYFIELGVALSKLGAHGLYLNTSFAGPQITDVMKREQATALVYDEEFAELVEEGGRRRKRFIAWFEGDGKPKDQLLEDLIVNGADDEVNPPEETGRTVILTSGTTGTPKGANRSSPGSLDPVAALLSRIPLKARETTMIAAPLFHSWGFAHWQLSLALSSTIVLRNRFDPEETLSATAQHEATSLVVVPVMLQRMLELPEDIIQRYDLSALKVIPVSGSALPGDLSNHVMDVFGPKLYNLYGSTEVAWATIATPQDLRDAPGTAGKPPRGTTVRIYDDDGQVLPTGETGRIFVGNEMLFEGYTGGGGKDEIDGLMASGDVGHFDDEGRLFVDGRDDDMIVSGGENVFPAEVEDLLAKHKGVREVAVVGVDDDKFGQVLQAYVVKKGSVSEKALQDYVKENLARYKVPKKISFMDELPRNATGKILKRELTEG